MENWTTPFCPLSVPNESFKIESECNVRDGGIALLCIIFMHVRYGK